MHLSWSKLILFLCAGLVLACGGSEGKPSEQAPAQVAEQVSEHPLFLTGTVVDPFGAPVPGAKIQLQAEDFPGWNSWHAVLETGAEPVTADARGAFRIHAPAVERRHRLLAWQTGYVSRILPCRVGDSGIRVELSPPISVRGHFLMSPGTFDKDMRVTTVARGTSHDLVKKVYEAQGMTMFNDGRFQLPDQSSGDRELWLLMRDRVLHAQPLTLDAREPSVELGEIDLRHLMRKITLTIRSETEEWLLETWARDADGALLGKGFGDSVTFFTSLPSLDLLVGGNGHRSLFLNGVTGNRTVTLPRGIPVEIQIAHCPPLLDGWVLGGALLAKGEEAAEDSMLHHFLLTEDLPTIVYAPDAGDYSIHLYLMELSADFGFPEELGQGQNRIGLTVPDNGSMVSVVVPLSNEEISTVLKKMEKESEAPEEE